MKTENANYEKLNEISRRSDEHLRIGIPRAHRAPPVISPLQRAAELEAMKHGCTDYEFKVGKHLKMELHGLHGEKGTVVMSKTPSCPFAEKKVARNVRHMLKRIGYAL